MSDRAGLWAAAILFMVSLVVYIVVVLWATAGANMGTGEKVFTAFIAAVLVPIVAFFLTFVIKENWSE